jgi:endo-1,4-beta-D-glucanase Y
MDIEKWEIQKKQSFLLDPLDISFEYGKINDDINDYKFQVVQDLGNPFAISKRNKLAKAGTESSKELLSLKKNELNYTINNAYYDYVLKEKDLCNCSQKCREN